MADKNNETTEKVDAINEEKQEETVETTFAEEVSEDITPESEEIKALEAKLAESENQYLRLRADFDNFRRRTQLDKEADKKFRAQSIISDLLPAIDNFERALQMTADNEQTKQLMQGMQMVQRNIMDALTNEGVKVIEAVGKEFDPNYHQAVMQVSEEQYASNTVVEELQKGYILNDRVIRPSMVKVNQ